MVDLPTSGPIYNVFFLILLSGGSNGGEFFIRTLEVGHGQQQRSVEYGIHASVMISDHPTSSIPTKPSKIQTRPKRFNRHNQKITGNGRQIVPGFEDKNGTTITGSPGGSVTLSCNIFMLQDYTVSWVHRTRVETNPDTGADGAWRKDGDYQLDLLTIGNSTYTSDHRISSYFRHPSDWGLRIVSLRPEDAGIYICQLSTFPARTRIVYLEIQGIVFSKRYICIIEKSINIDSFMHVNIQLE